MLILYQSEYIVGVGLFPNPTDMLTLIPFLERIQQGSKRKYENIIDDSGYASGYTVTQKNYVCESCSGCPHRDKCFKGQYENRKIRLSQVMAKQKEKAEQLIASDNGIILRMNRSIQVEGAFGVLKEDYAFRGILTGGKHKTQTQFLLLSFAFNIQKLCNRLNSGRFHMPLFEKMIA